MFISPPAVNIFSATITILPSNSSSMMFQRASLLLFLSAAACASLKAQDARVVTRIVTDTVPAWKTWKSEFGTMNFPGSWTVAAHSGDTAAIFTKTAGSGPGMAPTVSLVVEPIPAKTGSSSLPQGNGFHLISSTPPDGTGAFYMEYTVDGSGGTVHHKKEVRVIGGRTYSLAYAAPQAVYEENLFLAEAMMKSFSVPAPGK